MSTETESFVVSASKWDELFILTKISVPLCLTWILEWVGNLICIAYIGNLANASTLLASLGLSKTLFTILFYFLYGMTTSLLTLVPQAIGAEKYNLLPVYIQRCFYIVLIVSVPLVVILSFGGDILQLILSSDDSDVDWNRVSQDCQCFIIPLYIYTFLIILQRVPQSDNLNNQLLVCTIVSLLFVYPSCYLFVTYLNLGSSGYALNFAAISLINCLCTMYVLYKHDLLFILKPVSFQQIFDSDGIKEFLCLAIPGTILHVLEASQFEFSTVYCSLITSSTNVAVSTGTIIVFIMEINLEASSAMSAAFAVRVGKYVGANMTQKAQECISCGKLLTFILSFLTFMILISAREQIPRMYTSDEEIIELTSNTLYITAISTFFFMGGYARYGIFRGIGKPKYPAYIVLGSYYFGPLPLMFVFLYQFGFRNNLLDGTLCIFIAVGVGNCIALIIMELYLSFRLNWMDVVDESQQRLSETGPIHYQRIKDNGDDNVTLQQV